MTPVAATADAPPVTMGELALEKLTRVLGRERGERIYEETLAATGLQSLRSADDLYVFAQRLFERGGFEGAVGGLLSVSAVLRGATGEAAAAADASR